MCNSKNVYIYIYIWAEQATTIFDSKRQKFVIGLVLKDQGSKVTYWNLPHQPENSALK